jgi:hypothetical protein
MSTSKYSVGSKVYRGTSSAPNLGPVTDKEGYAQRDLEYQTRNRNTRARNNVLLKRIKAKQKKRYMSSENLSAPQGRTLNG